MENFTKEEKAPVDMIRVEIVKDHKGAVTFSIHTNEDGATANEIVGMIEMTKFNLIQQEITRASQPKLVDVMLVQADFDMDNSGLLEKSGKKVGDIVPVTEEIANMMIKNRGLMDKKSVVVDLTGKSNKPSK